MVLEKRLRLTELRKIKGWTQSDLASKMKVSQQAVSEWESGNKTPPVKRAKQLAEFLDANIEEFL
ncbi:helix-turn-helix transcriptional regulator [Lysinibacillus sp. RC79]|uniref:helix-turn-helix transcriptional regulator n=1 Tax=Lysinibacillus sp. RC79 TaxID=3156296 RepID=UPI00351576FF